MGGPQGYEELLGVLLMPLDFLLVYHPPPVPTKVDVFMAFITATPGKKCGYPPSTQDAYCQSKSEIDLTSLGSSLCARGPIDQPNSN